MGRELQKKKNRSSIQKVKSKTRSRTKAGKKKVNFLGNEIIKENWDRRLTVSQNYKRLGLSSRLNDATGGVETKFEELADQETENPNTHSLSLPKSRKTGRLLPQETRVERDPDTGHILRVIRPEGEDAKKENKRKSNPLQDPLNELGDLEEGQEKPPKSHVVGLLEAQAEEEADRMTRTKRPRQQSQREEEWIQRLVEKHGNNVMAMVRDRKLNTMQQTEGDLRRRVRIWQSKRQVT